MSRIEQVRLAMMIMNYGRKRPETVEETMALIEKIIKELKLNENK
jgi:hypothetical protein|tara:strand:- start:376 stop:510 length:135 start_codon:yes stop_codon:yes gene_type:complete